MKAKKVPVAKRKLVSADEAVPARGQHLKPCGDCPWSRESLPGWLGGIPAKVWLQAAHGEERIDCHTLKGAQCAGAATYRANVCKSPHDPQDLRHRVQADRDDVFASPFEFLEHHEDDAE